MSRLPAEIWHIICDILASDGDIPSLAALATSSHSLSLAFPHLYNVQRMEASRRPWAEDSTGGGATTAADRTVKWARFWDTLIRSAAGETVYNYTHYLKVFDVLDLEWFLETIYRDTAARSVLCYSASPIPFFAAAATRTQTAITRSADGNAGTATGWKVSQVPSIIDEIAAHLLPACPNIEELSREPTTIDRAIRFSTLESWITKLPHLRLLRVFDGSCITPSLRSLLHDTCPALRAFDIYQFTQVEDIDAHVSRIVSDASRTGWQACTLRNCGSLGDETFRALALHVATLRHLELWSWTANSGTVLNWGLLAGCKNLESIALIDFRMPAATITSWRDPFDAFFDGQFTRLRTLQLENVSMPMDITVKVLHNTRALEELKIKMTSSGSDMTFLSDETQEQVRQFEEFCRGLEDQSELRELELSLAVPDNVAPYVAPSLRSPLLRYKKLKKLTLGSSSYPFGYFGDEDMLYLGTPTNVLEVLKLASFNLSDKGLEHLGRLTGLRCFESVLPCNVTESGLLDFIAKNKLLDTVLFVGRLEPETVQEIEQILATRKLGRFTHFEPYVGRNDNWEDSDSEVDHDYVPNG